MKFDVEFFKFFIGMEFNPMKNEWVYIYYGEDKALEEEHVRFRAVIGNVLVIEMHHESKTGESWWETTFIPLSEITDFDVNMSWDELLEKKKKLKPEA